MSPAFGPSCLSPSLPLFGFIFHFQRLSIPPADGDHPAGDCGRKRRRDDEAGELTVSEISDNQLTVDEMQRVGRGRKASKSREGGKEESEGGHRSIKYIFTLLHNNKSCLTP